VKSVTTEDSGQPSELNELRWCLQALATCGSVQGALFPDVARKPEQVVLDFDRCAAVVLASGEGDLSASQSDALVTLDRKLKTMTRDGEEFDVDLWSQAALAESAHWEDVRRHAHSALAAFGWVIDAHAGPER